VLNVQDLPLDAATSLGMVRLGWFSRLVSAIERRVYLSADLVSSISAGMLELLSGKGVPSDRLALVPNWIGVSGDEVDGGGFRKAHKQAEGRFLVAYAGNLGVKQGVDCLLRLAKAVQRDERIHFFLIGDGSDKPRLLAIAEELHLRNTSFLPLLSPLDYRRMLADVDVVFVAQKSGAGDNFFPSKLLGVMNKSKPLLVAADSGSELARSVLKWQCGRVAQPDDIPALEAHLSEFVANHELRQILGENGRREVAAFDREKVLEEWRDRIRRLANVAKERT
jgi:colanic acid biosynthesis glycosyl transferase WcaI